MGVTYAWCDRDQSVLLRVTASWRLLEDHSCAHHGPYQTIYTIRPGPSANPDMSHKHVKDQRRRVEHGRRQKLRRSEDNNMNACVT